MRKGGKGCTVKLLQVRLEQLSGIKAFLWIQFGHGVDES